ncbi:MAG: LytTR family DNA-binding domain-containing protein [Bacteroidota bacterium]
MPWYQPLFAAYPAPIPSWRNAALAATFGTFVFVFLFFFQPFDLQDAFFGRDPGLMSVFGLISAGVTLLFLVVLPVLFPSNWSDRWRGWHQVLYLMFALLVIATVNGIYLNWLNEASFNWADYGQIIGQTFGLGLFPLAFLFLLEANYTLRRNRETAAALNATLAATTEVHTITLPDGPVLSPTDLLYVRAFGNYVRFVYRAREEVREHVARTTLATIEQNPDHAKLLRCHRSYLVNPERIARVEGNSQNLELILDVADWRVPVSRSFAGSIKTSLRSGAGSRS